MDWDAPHSTVDILIRKNCAYMTEYITLTVLWTMYMALETYVFGRP